MPLADRKGLLASSPSLAEVFPLPLTIFETFMLLDAREDYPMMCDLELHFEGPIERPALEAALNFALSRNRLFRSLVADTGTRLQWQPTEIMPAVDWGPLDQPRGPRYDAYVDLRREVGLRIWVRQGTDRSTLLLHFHHACADGMGGFGFIEDLLAGYAAAFDGGAAVSARPLDPRRLERRQDFGIEQRGLYRRTADWLIAAREGARFFGQRPLPLPGCPGPQPARHRSEGGFLSQALSDLATAGIREAAGNCGASINDVLLRDLFLTMRDWSRELGTEPRRRQLRILMPQNLRTRDDRAMPAANVMSFGFLTRPANACDQPDELLRTIHRETELIRRYRLSLYFLGSIGFLQSLGMFRRLMRLPFCFTTAVLTNLGDPARRFVARFPRSAKGLVVGNLVLEQITGGPPLRPRTKAAFSIFNSARNLSVSLKCHTQDYSLLDTERLLGKYVDRLEITGQSAAARRPVSEVGE